MTDVARARCGSSAVHPPHRDVGGDPNIPDCEGQPRRATDREIDQATAWVRYSMADAGHSPELDAERLAEYDHALEVLIHANGGRYAEPIDRFADGRAQALLDVGEAMSPTGESPPEALGNVVDAVRELARRERPDPLVVAVLDAAILWRQDGFGPAEFIDGQKDDFSDQELKLIKAVDAMLDARHNLRDEPADDLDARLREAAAWPSVEETTRRFLTTYRELAPRYGYEPTGTADWDDESSRPRKLLEQTCALMLAWLGDQLGAREAAPPTTLVADLADEAAHERVARVIHAERCGLSATAMWDMPDERKLAYALAKAAIDAYRAGQPWEPAEGRLARALSERGYVAPGLGGDVVANALTIVDKLRIHADELQNALDEAARDAHEAVEPEAVYDGGLSTEQEIHDRALGHATTAIGKVLIKDPAARLDTPAKVIAAVLAIARGFEPYIRDGAQPAEQPSVGQRGFSEGYAEAVRRLRDRDQYETWWVQHQYPQGVPQREIFSPAVTIGLADYLEATAPGPGDPFADALASRSPRCTCPAGPGEHPHTARGCDIQGCGCTWTPPQHANDEEK
ncbi:hypothetical protein [Phytohabitans houttuyneae]|uniref:Uncharacterized protein n=1 Tax=Phytohabitans houttuyneae TaxID=1076126 RepID=A0A6V8KFK9_9ACTN|nr:hypothetical protein [Phytohabitans houttuyneae]GFJ79515.1 hypothetical protein Phou_036950 [Phytohabitans houttuyneae]